MTIAILWKARKWQRHSNVSSVERFKPIIPRSVVVLAANKDLSTFETFAFNCGGMASPAAKTFNPQKCLSDSLVSCWGTDYEEEGWSGICSMAALAGGQAEPWGFSWAWPQGPPNYLFLEVAKGLQRGNITLQAAALCTLAARGKVHG